MSSPLRDKDDHVHANKDNSRQIVDDSRLLVDDKQSMFLQYHDDSREHIDKDDSILMKETRFQEKTVLDYRDFLNQSLERSRSSHVFNESFVNQSGIDNLGIGDVEDLGHHCHSDMSSEADEDPFYEYNKCHEVTRLELKDLNKQQCFTVHVSRFFNRRRDIPTDQVNIADEVNRLVSAKYIDAMS